MKRDAFFGLFLSVFLMVFTPFGLDVFAYDRFYIILGYGLVSYVMITLNDLIGYKLMPHVFRESDWKVYHQMVWGIWHLFLLGVGNLTYGYLVGAFPLTLYSFLKIELYVLASAIIPVMGITILRQNYLLKQNINRAEVINSDIQENKSHPAEPVNHLVRFAAENNKDYFEVNPSSIISISSQDNYVEFVFKNGNKIQKKLLRSTLGNIEEMLAGNPGFFRCHRANIINLNRIESVVGNSQGYRIRMEGLNELIPVARPKSRALKDLIHCLKREETVLQQ